jgi:formylmethanofuran dehydrogenase subunit E
MGWIDSKIHKLAYGAENNQIHGLLSQLAARRRLCPRQVLGVRIGLAGPAALGLETPRQDKRLLVIAETDGCFLDGLEAASGTSPKRRTMRIVDYGKVAASFIDVKTRITVRVSPRLDIRQRAHLYAPDEKRRYYAMLQAYQTMPEEELLEIQEVELDPPVEVLIGRAGLRTACDLCGEEIINQRQVEREGLSLCRACAGDAYYRTASSFKDRSA